jgi:hypothetical protein
MSGSSMFVKRLLASSAGRTDRAVLSPKVLLLLLLIMMTTTMLLMMIMTGVRHSHQRPLQIIKIGSDERVKQKLVHPAR